MMQLSGRHSEILNAYQLSRPSFRNFKCYRYSFNGKENDKEVSGSGNSIDFGARIYDSRVGRWFSRDDLGQYDTPYVLSGNNTTNRKDVESQLEITMTLPIKLL
jgi:RHS repeat-associated protein